MGRFKDLLPSQQGWIHELARGEVHPDAEKLLQLGRGYDPQQLVEESTIDFLTELREHCSEYARVFNSYSDSGGKFQEIKVYSVAQTAADFMIFRNQIKLIFGNTSHGVIQIAFTQHYRGTMAVDGQVQGVNGSAGATAVSSQAIQQAQDLLAQVGPFRDVSWTFMGEKVSAEQVAKFYFTEFARVTRDSRRTRGGNQVLIDQIKALLQEKGLDI